MEGPIKSDRPTDEVAEKEVARFADKYIFGNKDMFSGFRRVNTRDEQISGIDLFLTTANGRLENVPVDEKAALSYANGESPLPTFSLEVSWIGMLGDERVGWFVNDKTATQYYMLYWVNRADIPYRKDGRYGDKRFMREDNIREMEYCLVSRSRLIEYLDGIGWTMDRIMRQARKIRKNDGTEKRTFDGPVKFVISNQKEKPINLLLKKETYFELGEFHGKIVV
jgi:hypothetical protein